MGGYLASGFLYIFYKNMEKLFYRRKRPEKPFCIRKNSVMYGLLSAYRIQKRCQTQKMTENQKRFSVIEVFITDSLRFLPVPEEPVLWIPIQEP